MTEQDFHQTDGVHIAVPWKRQNFSLLCGKNSTCVTGVTNSNCLNTEVAFISFGLGSYTSSTFLAPGSAISLSLNGNTKLIFNSLPIDFFGFSNCN